MTSRNTLGCRLAGLICSAALALTACGGGGDGGNAAPAGMVGAAGGTVSGPNGARVVIPAGALASRHRHRHLPGAQPGGAARGQRQRRARVRLHPARPDLRFCR